MLEDQRINEIIAEQYEGGAYYVDAFIGDAVVDIIKEAQRPAFSTQDNDADAKEMWLAKEGSKIKTPDAVLKNPYEIDGIPLTISTEYNTTKYKNALRAHLELEVLRAKFDANEPQEKEEKRRQEHLENSYKKKVYYTIIAAAYARYNGGTDIELHPVEWQEAALQIEEMLHAAKSESAEGIFAMSAQALEVLKPWAVEDGDKAQNTAELISQLKVRGHKTSKGRNDNNEKDRYSKADATARSSVDKLRRKLAARMRENDHQRFQGGKKRGKLDKKWR